MNISISHLSAMEFWLNNDLPTILEKLSQLAYWPDEISNLKRILLDLAKISGLSLPLHILVPDAAHRNHGNSFISHVVPKTLPQESYVQLFKNLTIVNPECSFLLNASKLDLPELVVLANDLCATYYVNQAAEFGQKNRVPLTSVKKIQSYLNKAKKVAGIYNARKAIAYASDFSNSPRESRLAALIRMPLYHGGFAALNPNLNDKVFLSPAAKDLMKREFLTCDFVWPAQKVIAEYDSTLAHLDEDQFFYDKNRVSALNLSGYTVISITKDNTRSVNEVEVLFHTLRKALGLHARNAEMQKYQAKRKDVIRRLLLSRG